jgi:hypothetical protein
MAYTLNKSNGGTLVVVDDGTVSSGFSITFVGKNASNYGRIQNENLVYLLENFAKPVQPLNPIQGQIWFNSNPVVNRPAIFDGTNWRPLAVLQYSNAPTDTLINAGSNPIIDFAASTPGDLWINKTTNQLSIITNTGPLLVGPESVFGFSTTKMSSTTMADVTNRNLPVINLTIDGEVLGVISSTPFASNVSGFPNVVRGLTFKDNTLSLTVPSITSTSINSTILNVSTLTAVQITASITSSTNVFSNVVDASTVNASTVNASTAIITPQLTAASALPASLNGVWNLTTGSTILPSINLGNNLGSVSNRFGTIFSGVGDFNAVYDNGFRVVTEGTIAGKGVTSLSGTANQITVSTSTGVVQLSLPGAVSLNTLSVLQLFVNGSPVVTEGTIAGKGVTSLSGTANQITVSASTGVVQLSLPNTINAGVISGSQLFDNGSRVVTQATIGQLGVSSLTGTANQITVSTSTGGVQLSLPGTINAGLIFANGLYDSGARVISTANIGTYGAASISGTAGRLAVSNVNGAYTLTLPDSVSIPTISVSTLLAQGTQSTISGKWVLGASSSLQATYADLAENYESDKHYIPGTVLVFAGDKEVTACTIKTDRRVAGVVSSNPAYLMNVDCPGIAVAVALQGRVPVNVIGKIVKGDLLVTSDLKGFAESNNSPCMGAVIGKALSDKDFIGPGVVEVAIGRL